MPTVDSPVMPTYDEALVLPPSFEAYMDKEMLLDQGQEPQSEEEANED